MTEAELIQAVQEALRGSDPEGYYTTWEWAEMMGYHDERAARRRIKMLLRAGKMVAGSVVRKSMAGTGPERHVSAYRLKEDA